MRHLDQIKLQEVASKIQVIIFDTQGVLIESCDTLVQTDNNKNLYDQFVFLESMAEVFPTLEPEERLDFPEVEWTEQRNALFSLSFQRITKDRIQLVILDKTHDYDRLLEIQQSRNESVISEEVALLQKRVAEAENQLLEFRNSELKRIQEFKNEFFANVSHEMRTPLSSISGLVSLVENSPQKLSRYLPALRSTSQHLNSIINDILDISKIEAGKLAFESIDFDLQSEIENVLAGFQFESQQRGIELQLEFRGSPSYLKSDPIRIKQVLYNLLGNSLKFTEKGSVSLTVETLAETDTELNLEFTIRDTGIGMTDEQIKKALEPYAQASENTAREYGGTGLGMGIAIKLIEALGGCLTMQSEVGIGTKMQFELKFLKGSALVNSTVPSSDFDGSKWILAEDDPVNQAILNDFLTAKGVQLTLVKSGKELSQYLGKQNFDLVISDVQLEGQSGIEVLEKDRESGNLTPFLFISGDAQDRYPILAEFTHWSWLQKPVDLDQLVIKINQLNEDQSGLAIDLTLLEKTVGGDKAFMAELLRTISKTLPLEMQLLSIAIQSKEAETAKKILHKIKPSIDYLGIPELSMQRKELHDQVESAKTFMGFQLFMSQVNLAIAQLKPYL